MPLLRCGKASRQRRPRRRPAYLPPESGPRRSVALMPRGSSRARAPAPGRTAALCRAAATPAWHHSGSARHGAKCRSATEHRADTGSAATQAAEGECLSSSMPSIESCSDESRARSFGCSRALAEKRAATSSATNRSWCLAEVVAFRTRSPTPRLLNQRSRHCISIRTSNQLSTRIDERACTGEPVASALARLRPGPPAERASRIWSTIRSAPHSQRLRAFATGDGTDARIKVVLAEPRTPHLVAPAFRTCALRRCDDPQYSARH